MSELYEFDNTGERKELPEKTKRLKSGIRFTRVLLLLIMAVVAILLLFINKDKINLDNFKRLAAKIDLGISTASASDNAVIDFEYNASGRVCAYKDGIARVTGVNLVITDNVGTQFQSVLTGYNNPQIISSAKYVCAYDRGGTRLLVADSFSVVFETVFEDNIVTVDMNDNGYLVVVTESNAYKNHILVYNSSYKEVYKINSMNRYVVSASVSPDNKRVVLSSLYAKDTSVTPQINCYNLSGTESVWDNDYTGNVAVDIRIKSDGNIVALFDWGVCVLNSKGEEKYRYEFGSDILQTYSFGDGKYNVVVTSASLSGVSRVTVFDNNGKQLSDTQLDISVLSVDSYSDRFAVLSASDIRLYTMGGKLISQRENSNDATSVLFSDRNSILAISASSAVYNLMN